MISIIYSTNRIEPKIDWFIDSLTNQTTPEDRENIEIVIVDYCFSERKNIFNYKLGKHSAPKPNIYQGAGRLTKTEFFSPSNARNTGVILSTGDYIVFVDDVSVLMPSWWQAVKEAAAQNKIVCGAYQKHFEMVVEKGMLKSSRTGGIDSRWHQGNDSSPVRIHGSQVFGCSLGIPYSDIKMINGFDEICDSIGGEDYHFGLRLEFASKQIWYDRRMLTIESEELHDQPYKMLRDDRVLPADLYMKKLIEFGVHRRAYGQGNWDSSHMILDILHGLGSTWTMGNNFTLSDQRERGEFPAIDNRDRHWFDEKLLSEL